MSFVIKSVLSDISIGNPCFRVTSVCVEISFSIPTFRLHVSFALKWVFCGQVIHHWAFVFVLFNQSATLCLRLAAFSPLASKGGYRWLCIYCRFKPCFPLIYASLSLLFSLLCCDSLLSVFSSFWFL